MTVCNKPSCLLCVLANPGTSLVFFCVNVVEFCKSFGLLVRKRNKTRIAFDVSNTLLPAEYGVSYL